ncbi:hypothetical protein PHLGIDRAFT_66067, partial [Phlebiopsis gigantea 11061_1 CR5-6]
LFDRGHSIILFAISPLLQLLVVFTSPIAECEVYWQRLFCQGVGVTLAAGAAYASLVAVAHWFKQRKGDAQGFMAFGPHIKGTALPNAVPH